MLLTMHITGCATEPEGSPALEKEALSFNPPPDKAAIYVVRPYNFVGSGALFRVSLDYQEFGSVKTSTYLFGLIPPGQHEVRGLTEPAQSANIATFTAQAGKNYFFTIGPGWTSLDVKAIPEAEGKKYVQKFKLSGDNRFEYQNTSRQTQH